MTWSKLWFGKHKGKSLPQVMFADPDWFYWTYKKDIFEYKGKKLNNEAREIYKKSRSIRIPQTGSEKLVAEYGFSPNNGSFVNLEIVEDSRPKHAGSTITSRSDKIDLKVPYNAKPYDKLGYRLFINSLKFCLFGSTVRMTKTRCEDFFDNEDNFGL